MKLKPEHFEMIKEQALTAAREVKATGQDFIPVLILINATPQGELGAAQVVDLSEFTSDEQAALHCKCSRMPEIAASLLILECWHVTIKPGEEVPTPGTLHTNPNRRETILFNLMTAQEQYLLEADIVGKEVADADFVNAAPTPTHEWKGRFVR